MVGGLVTSTLSAFYILLGDGAGGFSPPTYFASGWQAPFLVRDLNDDGIVDIVTGHETGLVTIHLGSGEGSFLPATDISVDAFPYGVASLVAADFNRDGILDLALSGQDDTVILMGTGGGSFAPPSVPQRITATGTGDFNQDGILDLVGGNSVFLGDGYGGFNEGPRAAAMPAARTFTSRT